MNQSGIIIINMHRKQYHLCLWNWKLFDLHIDGSNMQPFQGQMGLIYLLNCLQFKHWAHSNNKGWSFDEAQNVRTHVFKVMWIHFHPDSPRSKFVWFIDNHLFIESLDDPRLILPLIIVQCRFLGLTMLLSSSKLELSLQFCFGNPFFEWFCWIRAWIQPYCHSTFLKRFRDIRKLMFTKHS